MDEYSKESVIHKTKSEYFVAHLMSVSLGQLRDCKSSHLALKARPACTVIVCNGRCLLSSVQERKNQINVLNFPMETFEIQYSSFKVLVYVTHRECKDHEVQLTSV